MALEKSRDIFKRVSVPLTAKLSGVEPAVLTWTSLPVGLGAAWCMMNAGTGTEGAYMWLGAITLMATAMMLDGLDGNVARATGKVTRWGDYLDHTLDRVLDAVWLLALGYNAVWFGHLEIVWLAALLTMFGSYMGTQAQAVAGARNYGGFSRADRMALTLIAMFGAMIMAWFKIADWGLFHGISLNPISAIVLISGLGGAYTFFIRFIKARSEIQQMDKDNPL
ncbi:MAG: CDP-alcohol phosphatidyltransferase family protein [Candidatus Poseidoniaceae archaeon]|jgi:phosphatidylglycerophosphate synthase|nr:CDP-alcohol phosphatidyltransferase family protein [Candidatus Thalassarchaeaceae archaeon]MDP6864234.1 CDP-alcohol phosphatidyltransferase family protein [Candidatus Poseidoniaceae archaeon]